MYKALTSVIPIGLFASAQYFWLRDQEFNLFCTGDELNQKIKAQLTPLFEEFTATGLLVYKPLLQNIYIGKVHSEDFPNGYEREYLKIEEDGGQITLDWAKDVDTGKIADQQKTLVIIHGLTGGSEASYAQLMCKEGIKNGYVPVVVQARGFNKTEMSSPRISPPDSFMDLIAASKHIK